MRTPSPSVTRPSKTQLTSISTSLPQMQRAAQVEARRVGQAHAGLHQRLGLGALVAALQVGQLQRAVDAQHLGLAMAPRGHHRHAFGHGHRHDVGQVVLACALWLFSAITQRLSHAVGAAIMPV